MERRAAVNLLIDIAENNAKKGNFKLSNIVNDLARRVAMSIESNNVDLEKFCSKMAAELMFRDDYKNANKILKIAQENNLPEDADNILPVETEQTEPVEPAEGIEDNQQNNVLPEPLQTPEGQNLAEMLQNAGVDVKL